MRDELKGSKEKIESITGKDVHTIAYPFGLYSDTVIDIAEELGYRIGFTIDGKTEQDFDSPMTFHRVIVTEQISISSMLAE